MSFIFRGCCAWKTLQSCPSAREDMIGQKPHNFKTRQSPATVPTTILLHFSIHQSMV